MSLYHFDACNFSSITLQPAGCQVLERAGPTSPHSADPLTLKGLPLPPTLGQLPFLTVRSSPWPSCLCLAPLHAPDLQVCAPPTPAALPATLCLAAQFSNPGHGLGPRWNLCAPGLTSRQTRSGPSWGEPRRLPPPPPPPPPAFPRRNHPQPTARCHQSSQNLEPASVLRCH